MTATLTPTDKLTRAVGSLSLYSHAVLVSTGSDGYPISAATDFKVDGDRVLLRPIRFGQEIPASADVRVAFSHIRPQAGVGYDERTYVEFSGTLDRGAEEWVFTPTSVRGWAEADIPFMELCERALPQARRYMAGLSQERGVEVKPRMGLGLKFFLATRLPFLTATLVPVFLGIAAAGLDHHFSFGLALLTLLGGIAVHLGLNVANDVFDARSGADDYNVNPTMFSGGSRVIQYGLVTLRQMVMIMITCYAIAAVIGLILVAQAGTGLLWLGVAGVLISFFYTAPPLKLVHRGLGEVAVALGFGPIMVLGAYFVQTGHYALRPLLLSLPVALLVMLILYANEIPDRVADARAGKRTLVVRLPRGTVLAGYTISVAIAYLALVVGIVTRALPWPTALALLTIPLAIKTQRGLAANYDDPYVLMGSLQNNVVLHFTTGLLLIVGTLLGLVFG
ncbi:MAG: 1,4-dihydroxy-2-naphthoate polyprenyltransferase [Chloroflexota bacterium]|nr:1,4-dihydroxy-2-naphthoate polyprenyltransferase [Chloroflexota bacterium]